MHASIGYKVCYHGDDIADRSRLVIVELEITGMNNEKHNKPFGTYRCSEARVRRIWDPTTDEELRMTNERSEGAPAHAIITGFTPVIYRLNETVRPVNGYDHEDGLFACGIHYVKSVQAAMMLAVSWSGHLIDEHVVPQTWRTLSSHS